MATANPAGPAIYRFFLFTWLWSFYLWMPIWLVFLQGRGLTLTQIGVLDAFGWVLQSVAELPTGALADLYGRKVSMALGAFLLGAGLLAVQSEPLSVLFLLGYMLWGVSHTFIGGTDSAFLYDSLKAAGREGEYTRIAGQYSAVMWTAQATAAVAGGFLATVDPALCFTVSAALALVAADLALTLKEPPRGATAARRDVRPLVGTLRNGILFALGRPQVRYPLVLGSIISTFAFFYGAPTLRPDSRSAVSSPRPPRSDGPGRRHRWCPPGRLGRAANRAAYRRVRQLGRGYRVSGVDDSGPDFRGSPGPPRHNGRDGTRPAHSLS